MCHGISPVSPVQSKYPCKRRWTGKDLPCKFVPVISPSCRGCLVLPSLGECRSPISYALTTLFLKFVKWIKKKGKKDQTTCKLQFHTTSGMQDEAEECEYPGIGSPYSVHFTCRKVAFVSRAGYIHCACIAWYVHIIILEVRSSTPYVELIGKI